MVVAVLHRLAFLDRSQPRPPLDVSVVTVRNAAAVVQALPFASAAADKALP